MIRIDEPTRLSRRKGISARSMGGMPWSILPAGAAPYAWDFLSDEARFAGAYRGALANTPGWSYTGTHSAGGLRYALNNASNLISFTDGQLRRTDKGVLIEGARTNLCLQSQTFDDASWGKVNATVTANAVAAPDGTLTADLFTTSSTTFTSLYQTVGAVTGTNCTATVYIKAGNIGSATSSFILYDTTGAVSIVNGTLTWATMTITGTGTSIERLGSTNWYRVTLTTTAWTSGNSARVYLGASGGPMTAGSSWYIWGAQLEAAAFPSSYIPTTTASVTRAADVLTVPVSGIDYPLSLFAEFEKSALVGATAGILCVDSGSGSDEALLYSDSAERGHFFCETVSSVQADISITGAVAANTVSRLAARIAADSFSAAGGGSLGTPDVSGTVPGAPTRILFGQRSGGASPFTGYLRRLAIFSRALSDGELQALTAA